MSYKTKAYFIIPLIPNLFKSYEVNSENKLEIKEVFGGPSTINLDGISTRIRKGRWIKYLINSIVQSGNLELTGSSVGKGMVLRNIYNVKKLKDAIDGIYSEVQSSNTKLNHHTISENDQIEVKNNDEQEYSTELNLLEHHLDSNDEGQIASFLVGLIRRCDPGKFLPFKIVEEIHKRVDKIAESEMEMGEHGHLGWLYMKIKANSDYHNLDFQIPKKWNHLYEYYKLDLEIYELEGIEQKTAIASRNFGLRKSFLMGKGSKIDYKR